MAATVKQTVTVQAGGVVQVQSPDLVPGSIAEVIVISEATTSRPPKLVNVIGSAAGGFASPADADTFIHHERDTWPA